MRLQSKKKIKQLSSIELPQGMRKVTGISKCGPVKLFRLRLALKRYRRKIESSSIDNKQLNNGSCTKSVKYRLVIAIFAIAATLILQIAGPMINAKAQSGALIPTNQTGPNNDLLSLQVMNVDVLIDNQHAQVRVLQIYDNHTSNVLEGKYLFALPPLVSVSDFAVWDGDTRIPGVIIEKRRANKVYGEIVRRETDPGLLQQDDEQGGTTAFSAKVFPIPAYGSKRVELEYTEMLSIEGLMSHFTFPLKPSFGASQRVGEFNLRVKIMSDHPISTPECLSSIYTLTPVKVEPNIYEGEFKAKDFELKEDFSFDYKIKLPDSTLTWTSYRAPEVITAYDLRDPALSAKSPNGYFAANAVFNESKNANEETPEPRNIILFLDTSLSMYGEKLVRAVWATDFFLHSLTKEDRFNLVLFGEEANALDHEALQATPENVERALSFIKSTSLGGGTNIKEACKKGLELAKKFPAGERQFVFITDANPTLGTTDINKILSSFENTQDKQPVRLFAFALGSDANTTLLEIIVNKTHGYFAQARETEDISLELQTFFEKLGTPSIEGLRFTSSDSNNLYQIYQTQSHSFNGSSVGFVGRYRQPKEQMTVNVAGQRGSREIVVTRNVSLPEHDTTHAHLPRLWARARVDALLREMNLNGEREDYISEISRLSQKYKFVTPYTAFLAAPRSLLRPRLIQPGDPVIRVKTDESIKSVFAVLPFGETLPLKYLSSEKVWEVRFLAPAWLPDGTYRCRLLLTDKNGNGYQEDKSFVVDSHAPRIQASVNSQTVKAGDELTIRANADSDTMRLAAKLYGAKPVELRWTGKEKTSVGVIRVPQGLSSGKYILTVTAEDFAHNQSSVEIEIEIF